MKEFVCRGCCNEWSISQLEEAGNCPVCKTNEGVYLNKSNEIETSQPTCTNCKHWIATNGEEGFCGKSPVRVASLDSIDIELIELGLSVNDRENIKNLILGGLRTEKDFGCINHIGDSN